MTLEKVITKKEILEIIKNTVKNGECLVKNTCPYEFFCYYKDIELKLKTVGDGRFEDILAIIIQKDYIIYAFIPTPCLYYLDNNNNRICIRDSKTAKEIIKNHLLNLKEEDIKDFEIVFKVIKYFYFKDKMIVILKFSDKMYKLELETPIRCYYYNYKEQTNTFRITTKSDFKIEELTEKDKKLFLAEKI